jgi:hypothetical protein
MAGSARSGVSGRLLTAAASRPLVACVEPGRAELVGDGRCGAALDDRFSVCGGAVGADAVDVEWEVGLGWGTTCVEAGSDGTGEV